MSINRKQFSDHLPDSAQKQGVEIKNANVFSDAPIRTLESTSSYLVSRREGTSNPVQLTFTNLVSTAGGKIDGSTQTTDLYSYALSAGPEAGMHLFTSPPESNTFLAVSDSYSSPHQRVDRQSQSISNFGPSFSIYAPNHQEVSRLAQGTENRSGLTTERWEAQAHAFMRPTVQGLPSSSARRSRSNEVYLQNQGEAVRCLMGVARDAPNADGKRSEDRSPFQTVTGWSTGDTEAGPTANRGSLPPDYILLPPPAYASPLLNPTTLTTNPVDARSLSPSSFPLASANRLTVVPNGLPYANNDVHSNVNGVGLNSVGKPQSAVLLQGKKKRGKKKSKNAKTVDSVEPADPGEDLAQHSRTPVAEWTPSPPLSTTFTQQQLEEVHEEVRALEPGLHYPSVMLPPDMINNYSRDEVRRVEQRRRQIAFGKNTIGYFNYRSMVPRVGDREFHNPMHPITPRPEYRSSKRTFDKVLNEWRRKLHNWDDWSKENQKTSKNSLEELESAENEKRTDSSLQSSSLSTSSSTNRNFAFLNVATLRMLRLCDDDDDDWTKTCLENAKSIEDKIEAHPDYSDLTGLWQAAEQDDPDIADTDAIAKEHSSGPQRDVSPHLLKEAPTKQSFDEGQSKAHKGTSSSSLEETVEGASRKKGGKPATNERNERSEASNAVQPFEEGPSTTLANEVKKLVIPRKEENVKEGRVFYSSHASGSSIPYNCQLYIRVGIESGRESAGASACHGACSGRSVSSQTLEAIGGTECRVALPKSCSFISSTHIDAAIQTSELFPVGPSQGNISPLSDDGNPPKLTPSVFQSYKLRHSPLGLVTNSPNIAASPSQCPQERRRAASISTSSTRGRMLDRMDSQSNNRSPLFELASERHRTLSVVGKMKRSHSLRFFPSAGDSVTAESGRLTSSVSQFDKVDERFFSEWEKEGRSGRMAHRSLGS